MKEILVQTEQKMNKSIESLDRELGSIRAGRANPAILDRVLVEYYGTATPINQVAAISVSESRMLLIQPWDMSALKDIERAISSANLGITPSNDGKLIRISFPPLTEDRRKELVKDVQKISEDGKISIRSIRRDANEKLKKKQKAGELTEDELSNGEKKVQKLTDQFCRQIDEIIKNKEKQIMEI